MASGRSPSTGFKSRRAKLHSEIVNRYRPFAADDAPKIRFCAVRGRIKVPTVRSCIGLLVLIFVATVQNGVRAETQQPSINLYVDQILASNKSVGIDPHLDPAERAVLKDAYQSYWVITEEHETLSGKPDPLTVDLRANGSLEVTPRNFDGNTLHVDAVISKEGSEPNKIDLKLSLKNGGTPIVLIGNEPSENEEDGTALMTFVRISQGDQP